jgi:hypothetical protein
MTQSQGTPVAIMQVPQRSSRPRAVHRTVVRPPFTAEQRAVAAGAHRTLSLMRWEAAIEHDPETGEAIFFGPAGGEARWFAQRTPAGDGVELTGFPDGDGSPAEIRRMPSIGDAVAIVIMSVQVSAPPDEGRVRPWRPASAELGD